MALKPILIHGPMACGKTLNAALFAKHFNKSGIVDGVPLHDRQLQNLKTHQIGFCYERPTPRLADMYTVLQYDDAVALLAAQGIKVRTYPSIEHPEE